MAEEKRMCIVTNRSASRVCYSIPEMGIKLRDFQPSETKRISYDELEALTYQPGGLALMRDFLQIKEEKTREELIGGVEPEYNMNEQQVRELIATPNNYDEWLDCLDFAPEGVIDMIKTLAVSMPLTDTKKMESFKEKTGIDIARQIQAQKEMEAEEAAERANAEVQAERRGQGQRRTAVAAQTASQTGRRTSGSKYKVVSKTE